MTRALYRYNLEEHRLEEITEAPPMARLELNLDTHYEGTRATDGTDVSTRRRHEEYRHIHGLAMAQDYKETWKGAAAKRDALATGNQPTKPIREAVERAWVKRFKP